MNRKPTVTLKQTRGAEVDRVSANLYKHNSVNPLEFSRALEPDRQKLTEFNIAAREANKKMGQAVKEHNSNHFVGRETQLKDAEEKINSLTMLSHVIHNQKLEKEMTSKVEATRISEIALSMSFKYEDLDRRVKEQDERIRQQKQEIERLHMEMQDNKPYRLDIGKLIIRQVAQIYEDRFMLFYMEEMTPLHQKQILLSSYFGIRSLYMSWVKEKCLSNQNLPTLEFPVMNMKPKDYDYSFTELFQMLNRRGFYNEALIPETVARLMAGFEKGIREYYTSLIEPKLDTFVDKTLRAFSKQGGGGGQRRTSLATLEIAYMACCLVEEMKQFKSSGNEVAHPSAYDNYEQVFETITTHVGDDDPSMNQVGTMCLNLQRMMMTAREQGKSWPQPMERISYMKRRFS